LYYKNSYILIYHQEGTIVLSDKEVKLEDNIISAEIKATDIILYKGIHAGMSKEAFFNKIFNNAYMYDFQHVDTFQNSEPIDGMMQNFIFQNGCLEKVVLSSDFDLIPIDSILLFPRLPYHSAAENAKTISGKLGETEFSFVGHSLGAGGQAALNSLLTDGDGVGRKAFTFNAAGVGDITKFVEGTWKTPFKSESKTGAYILRTAPPQYITK
jgi:hypothetical protein